jgi:anti-sigma factor RsiW
MKCNEIRNLVLSYLNSELDARTTQEIELHLQACPECAHIFDREGKFDTRLFRALRAGQPTPALWERIESQLSPAHSPGWFFRRWKPVALGGLAALGLAVMLIVAVGIQPWARPLDLASAVRPDHARYVAGQLEPQFVAEPTVETLARERGRLDTESFSKLPDTPGFRSEGKRVCHLSGVPVAWIMGRDRQEPVSIVVLKRTELHNFPQLHRRLETGEPVVCTQAGRFEFAARAVGEHVVCAMAAMPRERLETLLKSVPVTPREG